MQNNHLLDVCKTIALVLVLSGIIIAIHDPGANIYILLAVAASGIILYQYFRCKTTKALEQKLDAIIATVQSSYGEVEKQQAEMLNYLKKEVSKENSDIKRHAENIYRWTENYKAQSETRITNLINEILEKLKDYVDRMQSAVSDKIDKHDDNNKTLIKNNILKECNDINSIVKGINAWTTTYKSESETRTNSIESILGELKNHIDNMQTESKEQFSSLFHAESAARTELLAAIAVVSFAVNRNMQRISKVAESVSHGNMLTRSAKENMIKINRNLAQLITDSVTQLVDKTGLKTAETNEIILGVQRQVTQDIISRVDRKTRFLSHINIKANELTKRVDKVASAQEQVSDLSIHVQNCIQDVANMLNSYSADTNRYCENIQGIAESVDIVYDEFKNLLTKEDIAPDMIDEIHEATSELKNLIEEVNGTVNEFKENPNWNKIVASTEYEEILAKALKPVGESIQMIKGAVNKIEEACRDDE